MKEFKHKEIDLMLRGLGRQGRDPSIQDAEEGTAHLDADELNSYAEGVLPLATRKLYTAHLADCVTCRNLVTQLTFSAGAPKSIAEEPTVSTAKSFWQQMAVVLSPRMLRYAVPALVLLAVVTASFVALRQSGDSDLVALGPRAEQAGVTNERSLDEPAPEALTSDEVAKEKAREPRPSPPKTVDTKPSGSAKASQATPPAVSQQPYYAPEPVATAAPNASPKPDERNEDVAQKEELRREAVRDSETETVRKREVTQRRPSSPRSQAVGESARVGRVTEADQSRVETNKTQSAQETRTVAGTRFHRQGNAWVDVAYQPSLPVVNVQRGSEQFRALVADEPRIRTIAAELDGEVIVVLQKKAYRIR